MKAFFLVTFNTVRRATATITSKRKLIKLAAVPLYRNAVYLILTTAITSLLGFLFWMIVARYYSEVEVGYSSAIISAISLLAMISMAGFNSLLIRFLPHTEKRQDLINSCLTISGLFSIVIAIVFVAGLDFWSPALSFIKDNTIFAIAFIIFTLFWTLSTLLNTTFVARRRAGFTLAKAVIFSVLKIPLPILFVLYFRSFGVVASWGIALIVAVAIALLFFMPKAQKGYKPVPTLNAGLIKDTWRYSAGNYVTNILSASLGFILPIMVVNLLDSNQNAYFYIAWMISSLLFTIPRSISTSLFAEGSHFQDKLRENAIKCLKFTFLLLIPSLVVLTIAGKYLLLAFGQSYSLQALNLLLILSISSLPVAINSLYTTILRIEGRLKELMAISGLVTIPVLLVSYLIVPEIGIIGIGYAWLGAETILSAYIIVSKKLLPKK